MRTGAPLCCFDDDLMRAASAAQARFNSTCNRRSSSVRAIAGRVRWSNTRRLPWLFSLEPRPCVQTRHLSVWFRGAILLCKSPRPAYADASIDGGWAVQGQIRRPAFLMNCQRAGHGEVRRGTVTALSRSIGWPKRLKRVRRLSLGVAPRCWPLDLRCRKVLTSTWAAAAR